MNLIESIVNRVKQFIIDTELIIPGDYVLIALSGGSDSTALTILLDELKRDLKINRIGIAHYNHNVRGEESNRDENFCKEVAHRLGFEFFRGELDEKAPAGVSSQVFYREKRYDFLKNIAKENSYDKIATGHTLDDTAENVIMRLFLGTGVQGITGIASKYEKIIRPVVFLARQELKDILSVKNQTYVTDSSNSHDKYLRNSVRNNVIPAIEKVFPAFRQSIFRFTEIMRLENDYFNEKVEEIFNNVVTGQNKKLKIDGIKARNLHPALFSRLILYVAGKLNITLSYVNVKNIFLSCIDSNQGTKEILEINGVKIINEYGDIILADSTVFKNKGYSPAKLTSGAEVKWGDYIFECTEVEKENLKNTDEKYDLYFDANKITLPLTIRSVLPGDRIELVQDSKGKKIKKLLIDNKVPQKEKQRVAVIEDINGIIATLAPADIDSFFKRTAINAYVTDETVSIIYIKVSPVA